MEGQRVPTQNPTAANSSISTAVAIIQRQWHNMRLLPDSPQFIEEVYFAQGLTTVVIKKAQDQIEKILESRPTVKPLFKRRRLLSRAGEAPEKPKHVLGKSLLPRSFEPSIPAMEPSIPVVEPSLPILETSIPVMESSVPAKDPSIPAMESSVRPMEPSKPALEPFKTALEPSMPALEPSMPALQPSIPVVKPSIPAINQSMSESMPVLELSTPMSKDTVTLYAGITSIPSVSRLQDSCSTNNPPLAVATSTAVLTQLAKPESFTKLTAPPSMIATVSSQSIPKRVKKKLQPMAKKSTSPKWPQQVKKDKIGFLARKYEVKECQVILYDFLKNYGHIKRFGEWHDKIKNKEIRADLGQGEKKNDKKKRKAKDPKYKKSPEIQQKMKRDTSSCDQPSAKKIKKSDSLETSSATVNVQTILLKNGLDNPVGIPMSDDSLRDDINASSNKENIILADVASCGGSEINSSQAVLKLNINSSAERCPMDTATDNPHHNAVTESSKVKEKPVITLQAYHARRNSVKSGQDSSSSSSPTHQGTDSANDSSSNVNGHSSPGPFSEGISPVVELKKPSADDTMNNPSANCNSSTTAGQTPENKQSPPAAITLSTDKPAVGRQVNRPDNELESPPSVPCSVSLSVLKFLTMKRVETNNGVDPRRKLFLSALAENNNNSKCIGFERTSFPSDSTATAEFDVTSEALQPLLLLPNYCRTDHSQLRMVQWENSHCYPCDLKFVVHKEWVYHRKTCAKKW